MRLRLRSSVFFLLFVILGGQLLLTRYVQSPIYQGDEYAYFNLGRSFPDNDQVFRKDSLFQQATCYLYSSLLQVVYSPEAHWHARLATATNVLLELASLLILAFSLKRVFGSVRPESLIMAALSGFWVWRNAVMPDVFYFFWVSCLIMVSVTSTSSVLGLFFGSIICALAFLTKPHGVVLFGAFWIWSLVDMRPKGKTFFVWAMAPVLFFVSALVIASILKGEVIVSPVALIGKIYVRILNTENVATSWGAQVVNIAATSACHAFVILGFMGLACAAAIRSLRAKGGRLLALILTILLIKVLMASFYNAKEAPDRVFGRYYSFMFVWLLAVLPYLEERAWAWSSRLPLALAAVIAILGGAFYLQGAHLFVWDFPEVFGIINGGQPQYTYYLLGFVAVVGLPLLSAFVKSVQSRRAFVMGCTVAFFGYGQVRAQFWQFEQMRDLKPTIDAGRQINSIEHDHLVKGLVYGLDAGARYGQMAAFLFQLDQLPFVGVKNAPSSTRVENFQEILVESTKWDWQCLFGEVRDLNRRAQTLVETPGLTCSR